MTYFINWQNINYNLLVIYKVLKNMEYCSEKLKSLSFEICGSLEKAKKSLSFLSIFKE